MNEWGFLQNFDQLNSAYEPDSCSLFDVVNDLEKHIVEEDLSWINDMGELLDGILRNVALTNEISYRYNITSDYFKCNDFIKILRNANITNNDIKYLSSFYSLYRTYNGKKIYNRFINYQKKACEYLEKIYIFTAKVFNAVYKLHIPTTYKVEELNERIEKYNSKNHILGRKYVDISSLNMSDKDIEEENANNNKGYIFNAVKLKKYDVAIAYILYSLNNKKKFSRDEIKSIEFMLDSKNEEIYYTLQNFDVSKVFDPLMLKKLIHCSIKNKDYYFLYEYIDKIKFKNKNDNDILISLLEKNPELALNFFLEIKNDSIYLDEDVKKLIIINTDEKSTLDFIFNYEDSEDIKSEGLNFFINHYDIKINKKSLDILKKVDYLQADIINKYLNRKDFKEFDIDRRCVVYCLRHNKDNADFSSKIVGNSELCNILEEEKLIEYFHPENWIYNLDFSYQLDLVKRNIIKSTDLVLPPKDIKIKNSDVEVLCNILKSNLEFKDSTINELLNNPKFYRKDVIESIDEKYIYNYIKNYDFVYKRDVLEYIELLKYFDDKFLIYVLTDGYFDSKILNYINKRGFYLCDYVDRIYNTNLNCELLLKNLNMSSKTIIFSRTLDLNNYLLKHKNLSSSDMELLYFNSKFEDYDLYNFIVKTIDLLSDEEKSNFARKLLLVLINDYTLTLSFKSGSIRKHIYKNVKDKEIVDIVKRHKSNLDSSILEAFTNKDVNAFIKCIVDDPDSIYLLSDSMFDSILDNSNSKFNDALYNNINYEYYTFDKDNIKASYFIFRKALLEDEYIEYINNLEDIYFIDLYNKIGDDFVDKYINYIISNKNYYLYNRLFLLKINVPKLFYDKLDNKDVIIVGYLKDEYINKIYNYDKNKFENVVKYALQLENERLLCKISNYMIMTIKFLDNLSNNAFEILVKNNRISYYVLFDYYVYKYKISSKCKKIKVMDKYNNTLIDKYKLDLNERYNKAKLNIISLSLIYLILFMISGYFITKSFIFAIIVSLINIVIYYIYFLDLFNKSKERIAEFATMAKKLLFIVSYSIIAFIIYIISYFIFK